MCRRFLICGVPASGKTEICRRILTKRRNWIGVNFGQLMIDAGRDRSYLKQSDGLFGISHDRRLDLQHTALEELGKKCGNKVKTVCLIEGHLLVEQPDRFFPGIIPSHEHVKTAHLSGIGVISVAPADIKNRRARSSNYSRFSDREEFIAKHVDLTEKVASYFSFSIGIPFFVISNPGDGDPNEAINQVADRCIRTVENICNELGPERIEQ
jgi:adenylate kinase